MTREQAIDAFRDATAVRNNANTGLAAELIVSRLTARGFKITR